MYITAHFHGLGQTLQRKFVEVKKTDVNKFVYFQIQCTLRSLSWLGTDT